MPKFDLGDHPTTRDGYNARVLAIVTKPSISISYAVGFAQEGALGGNGTIVPLLWNAETGTVITPTPEGYNSVNLRLPELPGKKLYEGLTINQRKVAKAIVDAKASVIVTRQALAAFRFDLQQIDDLIAYINTL